MNAIKDSAIVVSGRDLGESDRIICFVTRGHGKIRAVAKGARRSRKRFLNALEPCTLLDITVIPSRSSGLARLDSVTIKDSCPAVRASADSFLMASLCCELSEMWLQENDRHIGIFKLFHWYLMSINEIYSVVISTMAFKTRLLSMAGYRQSWDRCVGCGSCFSGRNVHFNPDAGGGLCPKCSGKTGGKKISAGTLRSLAFLDNCSLSAVPRLHMGQSAIKEAWRLLAMLHAHYLQRTPRSYAVLENVLRLK